MSKLVEINYCTSCINLNPHEKGGKCCRTLQDIRYSCEGLIIPASCPLPDAPQENIVAKNTSTNKPSVAISLEQLKVLLDDFVASEYGDTHEGYVGAGYLYNWYEAKQAHVG